MEPYGIKYHTIYHNLLKKFILSYNYVKFDFEALMKRDSISKMRHF